MSKNWIKDAIKHPGALKSKAEKQGMTTKEMIDKCTKKGAKCSAETKKQAQLAKTLGKMKK